jgi:hypothetical protein
MRCFVLNWEIQGKISDFKNNFRRVWSPILKKNFHPEISTPFYNLLQSKKGLNLSFFL